jgi:branched-chain amino acid transport system ATP-binding protein
MTLRIRDLEAGYGSATVLRGVDLTVPTGAVVALLGANGAGKSTMLRACSGMLPVRRGSVSLDGQELAGRPSEVFVRAGLGHIPEGRSIFPRMSVAENLELFSPRGKVRESFELAAAAFPRLGERRNQLAGTLSGGEQQMLALARTYIARPNVVLVDEVSLGLAPKIVDEIFEFLATLVAEGTSLLLVEQYVTRALELADYVYILHKGEITFAGEPGELDAQDIFREYVGASL